MPEAKDGNTGTRTSKALARRGPLGWTLKILTFGIDPVRDTSYGMPPGVRRRRLDLTQSDMKRLAGGFRGAIVAAQDALRDGAAADHGRALLRLQVIFAETVRRLEAPGSFTAVYESADPLDIITYPPIEPRKAPTGRGNVSRKGAKARRGKSCEQREGSGGSGD